MYKGTFTKNLISTFFVIALTIALSLCLDSFATNIENIFLLGIVGILIILLETKNIYYALVSSIIFVFAFNYFFTEPRYTFHIDDPNYAISFVIFFVVTIIVGSLITKLQGQIDESMKNEKKVKSLYDMTKTMLNIHEEKKIYMYFYEQLKKYLDLPITIVINNDRYGDNVDVNLDEYKDSFEYSLTRNVISGKGQMKYPQLPFVVFPIKNKINSYGLLLVHVQEGLSDDYIKFIWNNITQLIIVLDRERIYLEKEKSTIQMENEKFKSALLRSVSHDLRTPLTSIQGSSNLLLESFDLIDEEEKKQLLNDVYNEACDLYSFVENLLNMTRLDEDKKIINKKEEVIDDVLSEVSKKAQKKLTAGRTLEIVDSSDVSTVNCDGKLLVQVFDNLVDNCNKHTKPNTKIVIEYTKNKEFVEFTVKDNGGGIDKNRIDKIFNDYYSLENKLDKTRNFGLGLSICKTIIEAHGGKIRCRNNEEGGATFVFDIPNK